MKCISCKKESSSGVKLPCPSCTKEMLRCEKCRRLSINYLCPKCGHKGP